MKIRHAQALGLHFQVLAFRAGAGGPDRDVRFQHGVIGQHHEVVADGLDPLTGAELHAADQGLAHEMLGAVDRMGVVVGGELRVVLEDGTDAPQGEVGEVWIRTPGNFRGYLGQPEETAKVIDDDIGKDMDDLLEAVELGFLLDIAEVVVVTAKNRKESRGGHMRDDFPTRDDENYMKHTMAYLSGDPHSSHPEDHIRLDWKPVVFTKNEAGELNYPPMERKY